MGKRERRAKRERERVTKKKTVKFGENANKCILTNRERKMESQKKTG